MSSVCQQPVASTDGYAVQLEEDITSILDELTPFCTSTKRRAKPESRWLLVGCKSHGVQFHQHADDTQLYIAAKSQSDIKTLEECTTAVRDWFTENGMLLNLDMSKVLLVARRSNAEKFAGRQEFALPAPRSHTP